MQRLLIRLSKTLFLLCLLAVTWGVAVYHAGMYPIPRVSQEGASGTAKWISRKQIGINQLILTGSPYQRGLEAGIQTRDLLYRQEKELIEKYRQILPYSITRKILEVAALRWFKGIEPFFDDPSIQEMYGVSRSASHEFDSLLDPFTRQIAYHGLHEVGQMMVDQGGDDVGCTVVALPDSTSRKKSWIIGRNFDFEGGRIFDSEKIMKWVFPGPAEGGFAFVSVIWAGMVGAVTGVNEKGVYLSINAAGSSELRRWGTPSTLILLKALRSASSASEAVEILKRETMLITEIFTVSDSEHGALYRVEKSPYHTEVTALEKASVITNHLVSRRWEQDRINRYRMTELTSVYRLERGEALVRELERKQIKQSRSLELGVLAILRDKGEDGGRRLSIGNRRGIDSLIAAHSVIYNEALQQLFVSQGPGVSGPFLGFDLKSSFAKHLPVLISPLPRDPEVSDQKFEDTRTGLQLLARAEKALTQRDCNEGAALFEKAKRYEDGYESKRVLGDLKKCRGDLVGAKQAWREALELSPAYARETRALKEELGE